jgi:tight adherence protein C
VFSQQTFILTSIFAAFSLGSYALMLMWNPYYLRIQSRMDELDGLRESTTAVARAKGGAMVAPRVRGLSGILNLFRIDDRSKTQQRLMQAGIYHPAALSRLLVARVLLLVVPTAIVCGAGLAGYVRWEHALLLGGILGTAGSLAPSLWFKRAIARHHLLLRKSLPDFLDLMIVCLEGGLSLQETIRRVTDELRLVHPELALEMGIVQRDIELGATVDQALKRFALRTEYDGVRTLSTFIRESQRFGTNITEALRLHADVLRSQREQAAEENAQKASVKILLPTLLLIFPAVFVVLVGPAIIEIQQMFAAK